MEPLFVNRIYESDNLEQYMSRESYYQLLSRLVDREKIGRICKGIYFIPKGRSILRPKLTEDQLVEMFTKQCRGVEVGEKLFWDKRIMLTNYSRRLVYTSLLIDITMTVDGVTLKRFDLSYTDSEKETIQMLEVLDNYYKMGDIDHRELIEMYLNYIELYNDDVARKVIDTIGYSKSTIDFLKTILDAHRVPNTLADYLSRRSKYKHPTVDELMYMADWDRRNLKRRKSVN